MPDTLFPGAEDAALVQDSRYRFDSADRDYIDKQIRAIQAYVLSAAIGSNSLLHGSGVPSSGLGNNGDFYIDTVADKFYGPKTAGAWGSGVSIIGAAGANGNTLRNGVGTPTGGIGVDGDFYIDTLNHLLYGPKTSGSWGSGTTTTAGAAGINAYTSTSANFTQPAVSSTVSVQVVTTAWMVVGQVLYIAGGGYYSVSSITDSTHVVMTNLGYSGNASPAATVASPAAVSPGGLQGAAGGAGSAAYGSTSANFTQPAVSSTVSVQVDSTSWMAVNEYVYVASGGYYQVSSITDSTHVVLTNLGYTGNASPTTTVTAGARITPGGIQGAAGSNGSNGSNGTNGTNAYTTTAANFTQPASSSTVTVQVGTTAWMASGQILYIAGGGYYSVSSITDSTHVVVTNLGYTGNASSSTVINSGAAVSPGGIQGSASGATVATFASRPSNVSGVSFYPTDGGIHQVGDGTNWYNVIAGVPLIEPPDPTSYTKTNFSTSSATKSHGVITFDALKVAGPNMRTAGITINTLSGATVTVGSVTNSPAGNYNGCGAYMRETSSGKIYAITLMASDYASSSNGENGWVVERWASATSRTASTEYYAGNHGVHNGFPLLCRLQVSGSNVLAQVSYDGGYNWQTIESQPLTTAFTTQPNEFGFAAHVENSTSDAIHTIYTLSYVGN